MNTDAARLARLGFHDAARSAAVVTRIPGLQVESVVVSAAGDSADPDQALLLLERICEAAAPVSLAACETPAISAMSLDVGFSTFITAL